MTTAKTSSEELENNDNLEQEKSLEGFRSELQKLLEEIKAYHEQQHTENNGQDTQKLEDIVETVSESLDELSLLEQDTTHSIEVKTQEESKEKLQEIERETKAKKKEIVQKTERKFQEGAENVEALLQQAEQGRNEAEQRVIDYIKMVEKSKSLFGKILGRLLSRFPKDAIK